MNEVELKFLNINTTNIITKLESIGAVKKYDSDIASHTFLKEDFHQSDSTQKYLRIRRVNDEITLTYKDPCETDSEMTIRNEIETTVSDFEDTIAIFKKLGFSVEPLFTKHRMHYELGNIHFEIDTVSDIPTYLEIETQNEEDMRNICLKMGLDITTGHKGTIFEILKHLNK